MPQGFLETLRMNLWTKPLVRRVLNDKAEACSERA